MDDVGFNNLGINHPNNKAVGDNKFISLRIFCAELFGTALFLYCGNAAVAQVVIGRFYLNKAETENALTPEVFDYGDIFTISVGYGLGLLLAICACGAVSGGHMNPAVTLTEVTFGRLPLTVLPVYFIAQFFGAFIGAGFVYTIHSFQLAEVMKKDIDVSHVFFTTPTLEEWDTPVLLWDQILGSSIYMFVYLSMDDKYTGIKSKPLRAVVIASCYTLLLLSMGINAGAAFNPARDFVPRIFGYLVGQQNSFNDFAAMALLLPFVGCILGGLFYEVTVRCLRQEEEMSDDISALDEVAKTLDELEERVRGLRSHGLEGGMMTAHTNLTHTSITGDEATGDEREQRHHEIRWPTSKGGGGGRGAAASPADQGGRRLARSGTTSPPTTATAGGTKTNARTGTRAKTGTRTPLSKQIDREDRSSEEKS